MPSKALARKRSSCRQLRLLQPVLRPAHVAEHRQEPFPRSVQARVPEHPAGPRRQALHQGDDRGFEHATFTAAILDCTSRARPLFQAAPFDLSMALGMNGEVVMVMPSQDTVVVSMGSAAARSNPGTHPITDPAMGVTVLSSPQDHPRAERGGA